MDRCSIVIVAGISRHELPLSFLVQVAKGAGRYDLRQTCERILAAHLLNKAPFKSNGDYQFRRDQPLYF